MKTSNWISLGIVVVLGFVAIVIADETGNLVNPFKLVTERVFGYKYNISTENIENMILDATFDSTGAILFAKSLTGKTSKEENSIYTEISKSAEFADFKKEILRWARDNQGNAIATEIQKNAMNPVMGEVMFLSMYRYTGVALTFTICL